jgi:acetylornithine/N-succinyldiaminopimelate aminotransferase
MKPFDVYPLLDIEPVKASGSWLWDKEGNKYLDFYGGHAVISIGHSHPHYIKRVSEQLNTIAFYSNYVKIAPQSELAEKLGKQCGYDNYDLFLCNSGAEANENALKLASFHTGRKKVISFSKGFHGRTSLAVAATDGPSYQAPVNKTENTVILPFNDVAAFEAAMNDQVGAVIIEGIQGLAGIFAPSQEFLNKIRTLCDKFGAVMILDEVQSGYGRTGKFFAHQHFGIKADLITTAKGMGNGFPIGGVLIGPQFKAVHGMLGTTFGGNHLACAAAIGVLEVLEQENLLDNAKKCGEYLIDALKGIEGVKEVRGIGLLIGIELEGSCAEIRNLMLKDHKIFTGSSSNKNTMRLLPALNVKMEECQLLVTAFKEVLQKTQVVK